ncbi:MAG: ABC transporter substrate-binding protein [Bacteroidales bacterium]|nr:ABC transporter substrate-binding protein [Bacteroidales bacterium]
MTRLRFILPLAILTSFLLGACSGRTSGYGGEVRATDTIRYARNLHISYYDDYVSVRIRDPWDTLRQRQHYVLVDRDKPLPKSLPEGGIVIRIPVEKAVIYTSVHTSIAEELGALDLVAGVCEPEYITSPVVLKRISEGSIADLGNSTSPNVEKIIDIGTDMIIASPFENSGYGSAEKLGVPIVEAADYMENHPLGRTEWVLFYGLLFGRRAEAEAVFSATERHYMELKAMAAGVERKPSVLLERRYGNSWAVPSGGSYIGRMHADAGANYIFGGYQGAKAVHLTFEEVFDRAGDADIWLLKYDTRTPMTYPVLRQEYEPYANFRPWKERRIFACNTITSTYYDDITLHPDRILEDLIAIYHPDLLPGHAQRYYFPLDE